MIKIMILVVVGFVVSVVAVQPQVLALAPSRGDGMTSWQMW